MRIEKPRAALKEIMGETNELAAALGDQRVHRLERVENAREGRVVDFVARLSAIEIEIGAP